MNRSTAAHRITFVVDAFDGRDESYSDAVLRILLDALFQIACEWYARHPDAPGVYDRQVVYQEEPPGSEDWLDPATVLAYGIGDCEDLACMRAAEYVVRHGIEARPTWTSTRQPDGSMLFHIVVQLPDGKIEDPSRQLGMI